MMMGRLTDKVRQPAPRTTMTTDGTETSNEGAGGREPGEVEVCIGDGRKKGQRRQQ